VQFINNNETLVTHDASIRGMYGVVCGHIHKAEIWEINGILYCNDCDWVESYTGLVETTDGKLQILHWSDAGWLVVCYEADATLETA
jgi:UDP-2,3-diacylglucosamine pyrophosphatase LpxH